MSTNRLDRQTMPRLVAELHAQFAESAKLEQAIKANLKGLGYELHPTNQSR
jgi:hypothetical protein